MKRSLLIFLFTFIHLASFSQSPKKAIKKLGSDPVFFIDSVSVSKEDLQKYNPNQIAAVTVFKGDKATAFLGEAEKDGAVFIETKGFAKQRYWSYFKSKSEEYAKVITTPESDSTVQYILNGKVLKENFAGDLSSIDDKVFKGLKVIGKEELEQQYGITDKSYGILIDSDVPKDLYHGKKKF